MPRARWSKDDLPDMAKLGGIFVAVGVVYGIFTNDVLVGALAGALLFGFMIGIGWVAEVIGRGR